MEFYYYLSMEKITLISIVVCISLLISSEIRKTFRSRRNVFIYEYKFSSRLKRKLTEEYPHLDEEGVRMVVLGLRDYFAVCSLAGKKNVAMPSQAVDVIWHEFILHTREYQLFCKKALGRFLHHTPATAMKSQYVADEGIKRAWRLCCAKEGIDPKKPENLPRLFAIDSLLGIKNGFYYSLNCNSSMGNSYSARTDYCANHIGCSSGCAGTSGDSDGGGFFDFLGGGDSSCGSGCGGD